MRRLKVLQVIPAKVRFISFEPLIGPITSKITGPLDWAISEGESGGGARACEIKWMEDIKRKLTALNIPVFVKQMGKLLSKELSMSDSHGRNIDELPKSLRVRKFPK